MKKLEKGEKFDINIDNETKRAEMLEIIDYQNKKYAIYSVTEDGKKSDLYVSIIEKDKDGDELLIDLKDETIKELILNVISHSIKA